MIVPLIVLVAAAVMMAIEGSRPGRPWREVGGWWLRAFLLNGFQAVTTIGLSPIWNSWLASHRPWSSDWMGPVGGALFGYFLLTFVYYWWHRWRHESDFLWRWVHQVHHSATRIEVITSFYKHPVEIFLNGILSSAVLYGIAGVGHQAALGAVLLSGLAELVYHWNVKTPYWVGFIFQRPESHCVHHQEGVHSYNYSDLPLWDMMFGTFRNPGRWEGSCGLGVAAESRLWEMLRGIDVLRPSSSRRSVREVSLALLLLGLAQITGASLGWGPLRGLAAATLASPAPRVFGAIEGFEAFSTRFYVEGTDNSGETRRTELTSARYAKLQGPYNRRNVYGAALAGAPILPDALRDPVLKRALCAEKSLLQELGVTESIKVTGIIYEQRAAISDHELQVKVSCP